MGNSNRLLVSSNTAFAAIIASAQLLSMSAAAFTTTWIADGANDWDASGSWDNGVPDCEATANFYRGGATVTAQNDLTVSNAMVNAAGTMTFELGGGTLFVRDRFDVGGNATAGFNAANGAVLKLASGTIDLGSGNVLIGGTALNSALIIEGTGELIAGELAVTAPYNVNNSRNMLSVIGPGASLKVSTLWIGSRQRAFDTILLLRDCAVTNDLFRIGGIESGGVARNTVATLENTELVTGKIEIDRWGGRAASLSILNSSVDVAGNIESSYGGEATSASIIVSNSVVNVGGNFIFTDSNGSAANNRLVIHQDAGRDASVKVGGIFRIAEYAGANNRVIINNGALEIRGALSTQSSSGNALIVTNGALIALGGTTINNRGSSGHFIELTGADASFETSNLYIGNAGQNNFIRINDGAVATVASALRLGQSSTVGTNGIAISGAESRLEAGSLAANENSVFEFVIPDEGFAQPPISIKGNASLNSTTRIKINSAGFLGRTELIEARGATPMPILPDSNFEFTLPAGYQGKLVQTANKIELVISHKPMLLILR